MHMVVDHVERDESDNLQIFVKEMVEEDIQPLKSKRKQRKLKKGYLQEMNSNIESTIIQIKEAKQMFMKDGGNLSEFDSTFPELGLKKRFFEHLVRYECDEAMEIVDIMKKGIQDNIDELLFENDGTGTDGDVLMWTNELKFVEDEFVGEHIRGLKMVMKLCPDVIKK